MEQWPLNNLLAFGLAFLLTGILIPQIILIAFRRRLFDSHDARKVHSGLVPRLGGISFVPAIIFAVLFMVGIGLKMSNTAILEALDFWIVPMLFLVCSLLLMFLIGMADDLIGVRYSVKFLFQIIAGTLTIFSGIYLIDFHGLFGLGEAPAWLAWIITVGFMVLVMNAINLIDGIDGLASGLMAIALCFYGIIFYLGHYYICSMLAWAAFGALLPFMYFNMAGTAEKRNKIFMGDTGSLTLGMLLAFLSLAITIFKPSLEDNSLIDMVNPVILAFSPLIVPIFDVMRVFWRRIRHHRNPFLPDKCHIHHKFLALGLTQRQALAVILSLDLFFIVINICLSFFININLIVIFDILFWILGNLWLTTRIQQREDHLGKQLFN